MATTRNGLPIANISIFRNLKFICLFEEESIDDLVEYDMKQMIMKPIHYISAFLVVAIVLAGCATPSSSTPPTQTETQLSSPVPALPTTTFTPTPRPTQTLTLTPPSTLEPEQARDAIAKLLQEPVDCAAPCFWGIVPGQTTLGEAKNIFIRLGLQIKNVTYEGKDFYGIRYDFDNGLSILVTLTIQDKVVENLRVDINPEKEKTGLLRSWLAYSPETLINQYGSPSKVNFFVGRGEIPSYAMDMYFSERDLIVEYYSYDLGVKLQVCPLTHQMSSVRLWMGQDPQYPPPEAVPLEKATSMTLDEFSKLMMGIPSQACFDLKEEMFP